MSLTSSSRPSYNIVKIKKSYGHLMWSTVSLEHGGKLQHVKFLVSEKDRN